MIYIISDLHGQYSMFIALLDKIQFKVSDHLYILGDVIDRGPHGIQIIQEIRMRGNITLLIGNHEYLMLEAIKEQPSILNQVNFQMGEVRINWYQELAETKICENWLIYNGGICTLRAFVQLAPCERQAIVEYLEQCYVTIPNLIVKDKSYYLVHAMPCERYIEEPIRYCDADEKLRYSMIWEREEINGYTRNLLNCKTIIGHTITKRFYEKATCCKWDIDKLSSIYHGDSFIAIDCGCAYDDYRMQLGCLCLDDMKEYYVAFEEVGEC